MVKRRRDIGIAIDNHCALEVVDGRYRVIASRPGAGAYSVFSRRGEIVSAPIQQSSEFAPLSDLLQK